MERRFVETHISGINSALQALHLSGEIWNPEEIAIPLPSFSLSRILLSKVTKMEKAVKRGSFWNFKQKGEGGIYRTDWDTWRCSGTHMGDNVGGGKNVTGVGTRVGKEVGCMRVHSPQRVILSLLTFLCFGLVLDGGFDGFGQFGVPVGS